MIATIPDWKGVPRDYQAAADGGQCRLQKADTDTPIYVRSTYCTCPDYRYRKRDCKHIHWFRERMNIMSDQLPAVRDAEVVPAVTPTALPPAIAQRGSLARNLSLAQKSCRAVTKDSYNSFHRYKYASAEALIEEGSLALSSAGLALIPVEQSLNGFAKEGEGRFELIRKFLLLDPSGDAMPIQSAWPVVPEKGRPLDKATAIASTLSLAYLLRDLLLMPRVDPSDDLPARKDEEPAKAPEPQPEPSITDEQVTLLAGKISAYHADVAEFLNRYRIPVIKKLPPMHFDDAVGYLEKIGTSQITLKQLERVGQLAEQCKIKAEDFKAKLQAGFGTDDPAHLSRIKAAQLIARLEATLRKAS